MRLGTFAFDDGMIFGGIIGGGFPRIGHGTIHTNMNANGKRVKVENGIENGGENGEGLKKGFHGGPIHIVKLNDTIRFNKNGTIEKDKRGIFGMEGVIVDVIVSIAAEMEGNRNVGVDMRKRGGKKVVKRTGEVVVKRPLKNELHVKFIGKMKETHEGTETITEAMVGLENEERGEGKIEGIVRFL